MRIERVIRSSSVIERDRERQELQKRLSELTSPPSADKSVGNSAQITNRAAPVVNTLPVAAKVALFRRLFAGRTDVYPAALGEHFLAQKWVRPGVRERMAEGSLRKAPGEVHGVSNRVFISVSDEVIEKHLRGEASSGGRTVPFVAGVYPLLADGELYVDRSALPPLLITRLARLAAFQNPEFYRAQAMRLPTYEKPRIICCASLEPKYVVLPRGCVDEAVELLESNQIRAEFEDHREQGAEKPVRFLGMLREEQQHAVEALRAHDFGVLAATTVFGKTVVAAALIAGAIR